MLPIHSDTNQAGCNPVSSNCVLWQGSDIPCLDLCNGDSVSDVIAKLAQELCDILDQLDITTFDLTCFNPICPDPKNFHDLVQFLIDKICELQGITQTPTPAPNSGCPDCVVDIAPCFYFQNELGDTIVTMQLADYVHAAGNKICDLVAQITTIQSSISNLDTRVTTLESAVGAIAVEEPPFVQSICSIPGNPTVDVPTLLAALESAFCQLQAATGLPNEIFLAISRQCAGLNSAPSLANPLIAMSGITNWDTSVTTQADAVNNIWLTICDLRAAVANIQANCCPTGCDGLVIGMTATSSGLNLTIYFTGTVPVGFDDCGSGNTMTITDQSGNSFSTTVQIIPNVGGSINITLPGTFNINDDYFISFNPACFVNASTSTTCEKVIQYNLVNIANCLPLTVTSVVVSGYPVINVSFNRITTQSLPVTNYTIILRDGAGAFVSSQTVPDPAAGVVAVQFNVGNTPLLAFNTVYRVNLEITIGGITTICPFETITSVQGSFWLWMTGGYFIQPDGSRWLIG